MFCFVLFFVTPDGHTTTVHTHSSPQQFDFIIIVVHIWSIL